MLSTMSEQSPVIVWFRNDLRLSDNPAFRKAQESDLPIIPLFILDEEGEGDWAMGGASQWWLHHSLSALAEDLKSKKSRLILRIGNSGEILRRICEETSASAVHWNRRYEPAIVARDTEIKKALAEHSIQARSFNGSLLQSPLSVTNKSGSPFKVFTPFWKHIKGLPVRSTLPRSTSFSSPKSWPTSESLKDLNLLPDLDWADGFVDEWTPGESGARKALAEFSKNRVEQYDEDRDFPAVRGVSRLSPHLHFGEISPNEIWHSLKDEKAEPYLRQIAWREFANHLLFHFPETPCSALKPEFNSFPWNEDSKRLKAWQRGLTGYPIVDAGMRELWKTGWMHNRVRMIAGSFLVKHLLQPWQAGAEWFWDTLVDADLANNTLGWQWVAGGGADASPYFRIFNPITQGKRFDKDGEYTRKWVPELRKVPNEFLFEPWEAPSDVLEKAGVELGGNYPKAIVEHRQGRESALEAYAKMKDA